MMLGTLSTLTTEVFEERGYWFDNFDLMSCSPLVLSRIDQRITHQVNPVEALDL